MRSVFDAGNDALAQSLREYVYLRVLKLDGTTVANLYIDEKPLEDLPAHLKHYKWPCKRANKDKKAAHQRTANARAAVTANAPKALEAPRPSTT